MTKKIIEIIPQKSTEIEKKEKKIEGGITYRGLNKEETDKVKKKIDEIAEKNKVRIDIYQKKTPWAKEEKNEKWFTDSCKR